MSRLLASAPYLARDDQTFVGEMCAITEHHARLCPEFGRVACGPQPAGESPLERLPFVHVGLFKRMSLVSAMPGARAARTVLSSSTTGISSRVMVDQESSRLQAESSRSILGDFVGSGRRTLLILDSAKSLRKRDEFGARIMAAMSLKPFASEVYFLLDDPTDPASVKAEQIDCALRNSADLLVYGFSWILWQAWMNAVLPLALSTELARRSVTFVHSGGWKRLDHARVDPATFSAGLLGTVGPGSMVLDYYGLVEQMGIVFPLCASGSRHVPRWADVIVRDSWTLEPLSERPGQLQLMNSITFGSPCHNVLTEDLGRLLPGDCSCGRRGRRFEFLGRVPRAEVRGCANV